MADSATHHTDHDEVHPTERQYWGVFVVLAIVTAFEVAWSYMGFEGPTLVLPLVVMMLFKFAVVAGAFMHLFFDFKILHGRWFTWTFAGGLTLAVSVFAAVIATFAFQV